MSKYWLKMGQVQLAALLAMTLSGTKMSRRRFSKLGLMGVAGLAEAGAIAKGLLNPLNTEAASNPIVIENLKPGTDQWQLAQPSDDTNSQIAGYASAPSVRIGGVVDLHISVNPPQNYTIDVYRMGYYGGLNGCYVTTIGPLTGNTYTVPAPAAKTGLVACHWPKSYTLRVPANWVTGCYMLKLTNTAGFQNHILVVVRNDNSKADLLVQSSTNTLQAYNAYGGTSLYYNSTGGPNAVKVSFDRPYDGNAIYSFVCWEASMVSFIEQNGYNATYISDLDLHSNSGEPLKHKALISIGHNEYWTKQMYDAALSARTAGRHLAFMGANGVYWQVRYESSNRVLVGYKYTALNQVNGDPLYGVQNSLVTTKFRNDPVNRPENQLMGIMFDSYYRVDAPYPYVVTNSTHWVYAGTGFKDGDSVPELVGYEWDRVSDNGLTPRGLTILSASPVTDYAGQSSTANSTIYRTTSGAWVFAVGTLYWCYGCAHSDYQPKNRVDARIQQTTKNVFDKFVGASLSA